MFLDATLRRNPELIKAALELHKKGEITPDTYVLDVDSIEENAKNLARYAEENGVKLYMMTKQIGRNPEVAKRIAKLGIEKAVAVDPWEAVTLAKAGIKLGNVGHLVQIPDNMIEEILSYNPEVVTVFTIEKARMISKFAEICGKKQGILLKVVGKNDVVYEGQLGGFKEEELINAVTELKKLGGIYIAGITAFPCFLYDDEKKNIALTENGKTVIRAAKVLKETMGIDIKQINVPSATSISTIPLLKELGATHGEPGHALTGTIPLQSSEDQIEIPSMVYVSEISHTFENKAYVYGGGYYRRSRMKHALVGKSFEEMTEKKLEIEEIALDSIDYYGTLKMKEHTVDIGDTVIYSFRSQIFVTRSKVALVEGIHKGSPLLIGIYDSLGKKLK